ncbi:hypothetical protein Aspvir_004120 [Aspergillus viridinutans]|uniref:Uncharacterized protein n=1 Tax=Aspergillus viridinutans TaxID=75553 RepID=A0A9P3BPV5_ASPVI|nr:uncharacterized protein Aspvir_004120 [Aspergillus viridinutans]GIK00105.1 hypothetical protein Aspvir_004120 [Aspergillus viridinutans]
MALNMTVEPVLDIEDALVSDDNPARNDGTFDYERCARLHNYLVAYAWMARHGRDTPDLDALSEEKWFFSDRNPDRDANRELLHPSLSSFLDMIYDPQPGLFYWIVGLAMDPCDGTFFMEDNELEDEGKARFVIIYNTTPDLCSHCLGVVYDQQLHRASFPLTIDDTENVTPVDEHEEFWFPLETILTHWISLIRLGKVVAGLPECDSKHRSQLGLWSWLPYCDAQVDNTVAAIDRYLVAVESRMPAGSLLPVTGPLFTDTELDAASVPQECFIRSVLTRMNSPRFRFIAPGLEVPHDKEAFARRQNFTRLPCEEGTMPAVLIFAASGRTVDFSMELRGLFFQYVHNEDPPMSIGAPVFAGLYSEPASRSYPDTEEAGFRLLLPFALRPDTRDVDGARMSDGQLVQTGSFTDLFQHGWFHPFGGDQRSQRMERLFDRWTELIESGVWTVGEEGVQGGIETFRDADNGNGAWRDYWIPPDW